jgi:hypothetical protein
MNSSLKNENDWHNWLNKSIGFCRIHYFSLSKDRALERWSQFLNPIIAKMPSHFVFGLSMFVWVYLPMHETENKIQL